MKVNTVKWKEALPLPICEEYPEYLEFYNKAWELAYEHIKYVPDMPQTPYMDEAFCATQIWIWDTCFMTFFCKYARSIFPGIESLENFYGPLYEGKELPFIVTPENEPDWTGAKVGKPYQIQIHIADNPPLFAWAEYENALMQGNQEYVRTLLMERKVLQKHYEWMENLHEKIQPDHVSNPTDWLAESYGYKWEGGRSGMDNTPRGRIGEHAKADRPNNPDMLWIDAICQQAMTADMIANLYALIGNHEAEENWRNEYKKKKEVINQLYWDEKDQFYYDIDCNTHEFYRIKTMASYWTLTSKAATQKQAKILVEGLKNPEMFGGVVPFVSLARSDGDFSEKGKYWRGAVWLPTAYAALKGIINYGYYEEAREMALKLLRHMYRTYKEFVPHTIWECYNPIECKPSINEKKDKAYVRKDFCGWSALGPISIYIEFVLGFHTIDAFKKVVKWAKPESLKQKIGIKNLRFGTIVTDIIAEGKQCYVSSNEAYILEINGKNYEIHSGENEFVL